MFDNVDFDIADDKDITSSDSSETDTEDDENNQLEIFNKCNEGIVL